MMWTAHKVGLFPSPVRICGLTLMPPTVGQYQILEHLESPYLGGGHALASELFTAVLLCWAPRWLGLALVRHPKWLGACVYFMATGWAGLLFAHRAPRWLQPLLYAIMERSRRNRPTWQDEHARFFAWMKECTWVPEAFRDEHEAKPEPSGIPTSYRMQDGLLGKFSIGQILSMSMPEANVRLLAAAANSGRKFETLEEYMQMAYPEGFAYHEEDFPTLQATLKEIERLAIGRQRILKELSTFGMDASVWTPEQAAARGKLIDELKQYPAIDRRASIKAAAAADLKKSEVSHVN